MELNLVIAENLKRLRLERNLSFGQLAKSSGVSKVMLSQIEKGNTNPTINTIWKIAKALKIPYTVLIDKHRHDNQIIKKEDLKKQANEEKTFHTYCYYGATPQRNFELFLLEMDSGANFKAIGHYEKLQVHLFVIEGKLLLTLNNEDYFIEKEESICFDSNIPHSFTNCGDVNLKAIIVNFYPA